MGFAYRKAGSSDRMQMLELWRRRLLTTACREGVGPLGLVGLLSLCGRGSGPLAVPLGWIVLRGGTVAAKDMGQVTRTQQHSGGEVRKRCLLWDL